MVLPFHIYGVISLVAGDDKKGLKGLKTFYYRKAFWHLEFRSIQSECNSL
tara:strand:- start:181 stop:330 length:150 start_codon:yes stop_codon:yes gene_type:complete